jgi:hypothetical protein
MSTPLFALVLALAPQDSPIPLERAARAFREAEEAALADGGKLWGHELVGPMIFADPRTRFAVANQPDERGKLAEEGGVFTGTLPAEVGIANTGTDWAGVRWTMVVWPLPEDRYARTKLLLHESFHRIQPELGHGGSDPPCAHLDTEEGRVWLRLEFRALAEACLRRDEPRQRALEDALLFRAARGALFPGAAAQEAALERNEGLAEYTGLVLCGCPSGELAGRAAERLKRDESADAFARSFAYATGPAYGVLLDELGVEWRRDVRAETDLSALLARAVGWKAPAELARAAEERAARHDVPAVRAAERARAERREEALARARARFVEGPLLRLPVGPSFSFTFDPSRVESLDDLGSVYAGARITDDWGILETGAGGALLLRDGRGYFTGIRVPAPADPAVRPLAGDGWTLALEAGWTLARAERDGDWKLARAP